MSRVKISFPEGESIFDTVIAVRIGDINYGGHVGNDAFLGLIHEARLRWLHRDGYDELNAGGVSLIMADMAISYRAEAFYGDELQISLYVSELTERSFSLLYKITTQRNGDRKEVLHAASTMLCFDYNTRKPARMTPELKTLLTR